MKNLPLGKQDFKQLIRSNCIYIDKTRYLISCINSSAPIFLSRPRRFGKSLTISTFKELFSGYKELFKNTYAYDNWDFSQTHPIIRIDLSVIFGLNAEIISQKLNNLLLELAESQNIAIENTGFPEETFRKFITLASQKGLVVILIDEYDAPILDNLDNKNLPEIKQVLRSFYKVIKANEEYIRFVFITGISKFSQVGVFSAMNNLDDISLNQDYSEITGYTEKEIKDNFPEYIDKVKNELNLDDKTFWLKLVHFYNGYSWDGSSFVCNPFSVLSFFRNRNFKAYWMSSGSPSFIVNYIKRTKVDTTTFENKKVNINFLSRNEIDQATPESFLTQAGYLSIKKFEKNIYTLDFPNYEVRQSFNKLLLTNMYSVIDSDILGVAEHLQVALDSHNMMEIITQIKTIYSSVPYMYFDSNRNEHFYSAILLMYLQAAGFDASSEKIGNKGRLDLSIKYKNDIYICELQNDKPDIALKQIYKNNYAGKYTNKSVILVGLQINFDERNVVDFKVESINSTN